MELGALRLGFAPVPTVFLSVYSVPTGAHLSEWVEGNKTIVSFYKYV